MKIITIFKQKLVMIIIIGDGIILLNGLVRSISLRQQIVILAFSTKIYFCIRTFRVRMGE